MYDLPVLSSISEDRHLADLARAKPNRTVRAAIEVCMLAIELVDSDSVVFA